MKNTKYLILLFSCFFPIFIYAQIENVIVEKYYVSDSIDATDTSGGGLQIGSITYRIYIDMKPGTKLKKVFGNENHALIFKSTAVFFNNKSEGRTFGKDFNKNRFEQNTVALDSWLTLGQVSKTFSGAAYFGVLKTKDDDGSIIGGTHNDGGSAGIFQGLLTNTDPSAGTPLIISDGLDTLKKLPGGWYDNGFLDLSGVDSTIFGSIIADSQFVSNDAELQNTGVSGVDPDSNLVLIAQLTTKGNISFELNLVVEQPNGSSVKTVNYVANGDTLLKDEVFCSFLKYPPACGCSDIRYLEYSPIFSCSSVDSCKTLKVFGCTDTMACNYDPRANVLLKDFCCYPGFCSDRDISLACPSLSIARYSFYPNPAHDQLVLEISDSHNKGVKYDIYDVFGRLVFEKNLGIVSGYNTQNIDISNFENGVYMLRLSFGDVSTMKTFFKN